MDLTGHEAPTYPERLGHRGPHLLHDYLSKESPDPEERHSCVEEDSYISEKDREILYNSKFSQVSALRKRRQEPHQALTRTSSSSFGSPVLLQTPNTLHPHPRFCCPEAARRSVGAEPGEDNSRVGQQLPVL
jgi:hypothetical protein